MSSRSTMDSSSSLPGQSYTDSKTETHFTQNPDMDPPLSHTELTNADWIGAPLVDPNWTSDFESFAEPVNYLGQEEPSDPIVSQPDPIQAGEGPFETLSLPIDPQPAFPGDPESDVFGTGTYFLPNIPLRAELPGETSNLLYDDGSYSKRAIDVKPMNAPLYTTKAKSSRKRQKSSCMTCRKKRIRCNPEHPRCVQCKQSGSICEWRNA